MVLHRIIPVQARRLGSCTLGALWQDLVFSEVGCWCAKRSPVVSSPDGPGLTTSFLEQRGTYNGKTPTLIGQIATNGWSLFWWHLQLNYSKRNYNWNKVNELVIQPLMHTFGCKWLQKRPKVGQSSLLWENCRAFLCQEFFSEPFSSPVLSNDYQLPKMLTFSGNIHGNH